jgi:hypothetical protein
LTKEQGWANTAPPDGIAAISVIANETTNLDFANFRPVPGDFNLDGAHDVQDIDVLCSTLRDGVYDSLFDLNGDRRLSLRDLDWLVVQVFETSAGDANLDKRFDSSDLVAVWQAGEYEDGIPNNSTWAEGDWNCDGEFNAFDLVKAFQNGKYVRAATPASSLPTDWTIRQLNKAAANRLEQDDGLAEKRKALHILSANLA